MRSKAVVFTSPGDVCVKEVESPDATSTQMVVELTHSWISPGTERSFLFGERVDGDEPYTGEGPPPFPLVPGYQRVGHVTWVGSDVDGFIVGDTVFAAPGWVSDMFLPYGGHISPSVVSPLGVLKLPAGLPSYAYAGLILTQVGYNCGTRFPLEIGERCLVLGDGLVGQWAAQTLAWRGADVWLAGHRPERMRRFCPELAPNRNTLYVDGEDLDAAFDEIGEDPTAFIDTVGSSSAMAVAARRMRRGGHIVSAGFYGTNDALHLQPARDREVSIHMVAGSTPRRREATLRLIAGGQLDTVSLITHHFPVQDARVAWDLLLHRDEDHLGVILDW